MKIHEIKEGQQVKVVNLTEGPGVGVIDSEYLGKTGEVIIVDPSDETARVRFADDDHMWCNARWLELDDDASMIKLKRESIGKIYDVACSDWKDNITSHVTGLNSPFAKHVSITREFAEKMISAATDRQRPVVISVLEEGGYKQAEKEWHNFGDSFTVDTKTHETDKKLYIRNGHASSTAMERREIGFTGCKRVKFVIEGEEHIVERPGHGTYFSIIS